MAIEEIETRQHALFYKLSRGFRSKPNPQVGSVSLLQ